jgi:hypothetical protein
VGKVSAWIAPDAADAALASRSGAGLSQELAWAAFLGLQAVLVPGPQQLAAPFNYAQAINQVRVCVCGVQEVVCSLPPALLAGSGQTPPHCEVLLISLPAGSGRPVSHGHLGAAAARSTSSSRWQR